MSGPRTGHPASDAAEILERDYGIDAGEVLSMNVDTVETVSSGVQADTPDFAEAVNDPQNWEPYGQKTYRAAFADPEGYILSRIVGSNPSKQGYYDDVTALPAEGDGTPEEYYLVRMNRDSGGAFTSYDVKSSVPEGTTTGQLLDRTDSGAYQLNGAIYSYVIGGNWGTLGRQDYAGWWGTALLNNNEYDSDNIDASFRLIKGGNLNEGFCFFVNKKDVQTSSGGTSPRLSGYFMSVCSHNTQAVRSLWRFDDYLLDTNFSNTRPLMDCAAGHSYTSPNGINWYAGHQAQLDNTNTGVPSRITCLATWIDDAQNIDYNIKADKDSIVVKRVDNGEDVDGSANSSINAAEAISKSYSDTKSQEYIRSLQTSGSATINSTPVIFPNTRGVEEVVADISITDNEDGTIAYYDEVSNTNSTVRGESITKGTYGLWGNNCEQGNQALITDLNVSIEKTIVKSFGDIVYEPTWTDGALHMLINIDTAADRTMLGSDGGTESSTRLSGPT